MLRDIGGRVIGPDAPVFVVAEIGLNHGGFVDRALALVDAAAWAGASAVKLQTLDADRLVAASCPAPAHVSAASLQSFFAQFELDDAAHREVVTRARERGLAVITTPLYEEAVPMLESLGFDAYKIASGDLTCHPLITAAAATRRPLIMSTGMSDVPEIREAVAACRGSGTSELALLHCVSAYPTPGAQQNLRAIRTLAETFGYPAGLSDHGSTAVSSAITAVALGGCVYERHLVLADDHDAVDRVVSSTPEELRTIIAEMERARVALGNGIKVCQPAEAKNVSASRRGLYAARDLRPGERIAAQDVAALRPATQLLPSRLSQLVGGTVRRHIAAGTAFSSDDLAGVMGS